MADDGRNELISRLLPASFRGVRFFVRGIATSGGRKATERPIVNSDEQAVDDVGKMQRVYDVGAYVTAIYESTANDTSISVPYAQPVDVAIVIGANDVVNPVARTDPKSPIAGMPIIDVDKCRTVIVVKRSLSPGFAGIPNPLFAAPNTLMLYADGQKAVLDIVKALKEVA